MGMVLEDLDRINISDKTKKALEKIGLTSYEIRTFAALLKSGEQTASEISQKSGVPYSKIYEVLGTKTNKIFCKVSIYRTRNYKTKNGN
jgi:sugar-specific transcriptional regulator TrmB